MECKQILKFADLFAKPFYKSYKKDVAKACKQEFDRLKLENTAFYADSYKKLYIGASREAVGRIMAIMCAADDWRIIAIVLGICLDEQARNELYNYTLGVGNLDETPEEDVTEMLKRNIALTDHCIEHIKTLDNKEERKSDIEYLETIKELMARIIVDYATNDGEDCKQGE